MSFNAQRQRGLNSPASTSTVGNSNNIVQHQQLSGTQSQQPFTSSISSNEQHSHASVPKSVASKHRFNTEMSQCLYDFVLQLLPTQEEMAVKEDVRKLLERLIRSIEPNSRLLSFGSTANGFSLRNSDMDLCCLIDSKERLSASELVTMLGDLLERETKFHVKPLPHARIPIVKLSLDPSPGLPFGIACDIGFENRLALENTRLLMCYGMIDPPRVRTMVLFLKVWCKRRKINSPYKGTLSSYGYVLLVIYFLVHVKNPPVLPNLQQIPPLRPIPTEEYHIGDHNVWFFDDIELLRQRWKSENTETVAALLVDFFRYYAREFQYSVWVASIRAGLLKKSMKGWFEPDPTRMLDARERNRFCIEDPLETDFNVARCVTKDGLYTIRGEFMRASRILAARPERAVMALAQLCEERKDEELVRAVPPQSKISIPPQAPYTVGSNFSRANGARTGDRLSPPRAEVGAQPPVSRPVSIRAPPEHMAPKRGKWTSPPPPDAPADDHKSFENRLGLGLSLATSSTDARQAEKENAELSSSSNSEVLTDEEHAGSDIAPEDDVASVRSFSEEHSLPNVEHDTRKGTYSVGPPSLSYRPTHHRMLENRLSGSQFRNSLSGMDTHIEGTALHIHRGRKPARLATEGLAQVHIPSSPRSSAHLPGESGPSSSGSGLSTQIDTPKRSVSGPSRNLNPSITHPMSSPVSTPLPPSPTLRPRPNFAQNNNALYYETPPNRLSMSSYPTPPFTVNPFPLYQQRHQQQFVHTQRNQSPSLSPVSPLSNRQISRAPSNTGSPTATDAPPYSHPQFSHSHNNSTSTIVAPTTPSTSNFATVPPTPPSDQRVMVQSNSPSRLTHQIPIEVSSVTHRRFLASATPPSPVSVGSISPPRSLSSAGSGPSSTTSPRFLDTSATAQRASVVIPDQGVVSTANATASVTYAESEKTLSMVASAAIDNELTLALQRSALQDKS